MAELQLQI